MWFLRDVLAHNLIVAWLHLAITWTDLDSISARSSDRDITQKPIICRMFHSNLHVLNKLTELSSHEPDVLCTWSDVFPTNRTSAEYVGYNEPD